MQEFSPSLVRNVVRDAEVTESDLSDYERYDHPAEDSYGRTMVYDGGFFEVMVMSWNPGDISGIHDHGYTQWGAVQVFGLAEHATFLVQDNTIRTLARMTMKAGDVVGVGHQLVHQMGNCQESGRYLSLHVYGNYDRSQGITDDARIFDLAEGTIQINSGGAFFGIPEASISERIPAPTPDYATWLRNQVELIKRLRKAGDNYKGTHVISKLVDELFDVSKFKQLEEDLEEALNESGHTNDSNYWNMLNWELKNAAELQRELLQESNTSDSFQNYAALYDEVIGKPCLHNFMKQYLAFFFEHYNINSNEATMLSIGCGTGLVENHLIKEMGIKHENLLGIDYSEAMVNVAAKHIQAEWGDALHLDPAIQTWDLAYCGLNVFQYIGHSSLQEAVARVSKVVNSGGYFIGDFITTDHIRWYPNAIFSEDHNIVSMRTPSLIEKDNFMYQRSSIVNVRTDQGKMRITYEGEHERFLPPLSRIRSYFAEVFDTVEIYDAVSLQPIEVGRDTCASTRYFVVAGKK